MNNPFEYMQQFMNQGNASKAFNSNPEMMKNMFNMMDWNNFSNLMKHNAETISSVGQMANESMQSIMKRGADSLQKNTSEMFNSMKDSISSGDAQQLSVSGQKYMQKTLHDNINNTKEMLDVASKSSMEILDVLGKSMTENMNSAFKKANINSKQ